MVAHKDVSAIKTVLSKLPHIQKRHPSAPKLSNPQACHSHLGCVLKYTSLAPSLRSLWLWDRRHNGTMRNAAVDGVPACRWGEGLVVSRAQFCEAFLHQQGSPLPGRTNGAGGRQ